VHRTDLDEVTEKYYKEVADNKLSLIIVKLKVVINRDGNSNVIEKKSCGYLKEEK